jgi:hypothetical protein
MLLRQDTSYKMVLCEGLPVWLGGAERYDAVPISPITMLSALTVSPMVIDCCCSCWLCILMFSRLRLSLISSFSSLVGRRAGGTSSEGLGGSTKACSTLLRKAAWALA